MVNKKVLLHVNHVMMYINNRIVAGINPDDLTLEVLNKFRMELAFFNTKPEMLENLVEILCLQAYFQVNKEHYNYLKNGVTNG